MKVKIFLCILLYLLPAIAAWGADTPLTLEEAAFLREALSLPNQEWKNYVKAHYRQIDKGILKKMEDEMAVALKDPKGAEFAWNLAALADTIAAQLREPANYRLGLASYQFEQKNYGLVLDICSNIFIDYPRDAKTYILQGMTFEAMGDAVAAFTSFKNAIKYEPKNAQAHYQLAMLYQRANQTDQAEAEMKIARQLNPAFNFDTPAQPKVSPVSSGVSVLPPADAAKTAPAAPAPVAQAPAAPVPAAQAPVPKTTLDNPGQVKVTIEGGVSSSVYGDADLAGITNAEQAITLGDGFFQQGDWDNAILAYQKATELNPNYSKAFAFLGSAYLRKNQSDEAIDALKTAIALDPEAVQAHRLLGSAYEQKFDRTGDEQWIDDAIASYMTALDLAPEDEATKQYLLMALKKKP